MAAEAAVAAEGGGGGGGFDWGDGGGDGGTAVKFLFAVVFPGKGCCQTGGAVEPDRVAGRLLATAAWRSVFLTTQARVLLPSHACFMTNAACEVPRSW